MTFPVFVTTSGHQGVTNSVFVTTPGPLVVTESDLVTTQKFQVVTKMAYDGRSRRASRPDSACVANVDRQALTATSSSARRRARAFGKRSAGSFSRQRRITLDKAGVSSGRWANDQV